MLLEIAGVPKTMLCQFGSVATGGRPSPTDKREQDRQAGAKASISPAPADIVVQARLEYLDRSVRKSPTYTTSAWPSTPA